MGQLQTIDYGSNSVFYRYDAAGNRIAKTVFPSGTIENTSPDAPSLIFPSNAATNVETQPELRWSGSDPDVGNVVSFTIYFGEENNLQPLLSGSYETAFVTPQLKPKTTYYWKIEARDNYNAATTSPVNSFETGDKAPGVPNSEIPFVDSYVVYESVNLRWSCQDPDVVDSLSYDIYFGTSPDPPLVQSGVADTTYSLGPLSPGTTYYWRIVAKDLHGTCGTLHTFTYVIWKRVTPATCCRWAEGPRGIA